MKYIVIQSILILGFNSILNAQEIPEEFIENEIYNLSVDIGENWESYTTLGSPRFQLSQNELNQLNIHSRFGFQSINNSIALYGFGHFTFNNNFYGYLYPRIVNDIDAFPGILVSQEILLVVDSIQVKQIYQGSGIKVIGSQYSWDEAEKTGELGQISN